MITKRELLRLFPTQVAIAALLGISKQAVARWQMDAPIPREQELRLRYELAPEKFENPDTDRDRTTADGSGADGGAICQPQSADAGHRRETTNDGERGEEVDAAA